eukprot:TRINITY_DN4570_c0_g2_i1.p2 TRINITY_DN4570_c0_g2~~TRINITY_DN4570_c0_g2_i1.p2  ORF type:complete len:157 (+),score=14.69 TRINITY_DN4570_c0_g2_i1:90-560(+)
MGGGDDALAPVLAAVVVGVEKVDAHGLGGVHGDPLDGDGVPAEKARGAVGHRDTGRLWIDHGNVAVIERVIGGVEIPDKPFEVFQAAGENVHGDAKSVANVVAVKLGVDPFVGILSAANTAPPHFKIDTVQMRHGQQGYGIDIHGRFGCQSGAKLL